MRGLLAPVRVSLDCLANKGPHVGLEPDRGCAFGKIASRSPFHFGPMADLFYAAPAEIFPPNCFQHSVPPLIEPLQFPPADTSEHIGGNQGEANRRIEVADDTIR